ncbi:FRG domain-containing protein [Bacillus thuringiensis]|uniref:FRG domain-containing protein n=1 Tax=Bacillus thuringiensis TaxID=1428 RepID=UPI000BF71F4B|nr:FRG domain-containing protein [Bacillus thuringiensis]PFA08034.1 FRG domain-containing protein [Bacillus thuringiensis]
MTTTEQYLKRETSGLHTPAVTEIKNLSEYIDLLSSGEFKNYLFRGEPTNYDETFSSGLRNTTPPGYNSEQEVKGASTFLNMQKEFKKEVWYKLTPDERTHFSAFSQHHGIPTNLIDITTSPLVSLYFACQKYENPKDTNKVQLDEERGFVYVFKDKFIDITNTLTKFEDENILEIFASNNDDIFLDMYVAFLRFEKDHPKMFYEYLKKQNTDLHEHIKSFPVLSYMTTINVNKFPPYENGRYQTIYFEPFRKLLELERYKNLNRKIQNPSWSVFIYTAYLQKVLEGIHFRPVDKSTWLNIIPNFKYAPILTFERGRNQQGLFIYQNYLQSGGFIKDPYIEGIQRIVPDKVVVINNKEKILEELDFMGINEKFIYGDYDHIASYIRNKRR